MKYKITYKHEFYGAGLATKATKEKLPHFVEANSSEEAIKCARDYLVNLEESWGHWVNNTHRWELLVYSDIDLEIRSAYFDFKATRVKSQKIR